MTSNTNFKSKKNPEDIPDFFPQKQPKSGIQIYITPTKRQETKEARGQK
jgi:hypothetical protein